MQGGGPTSFHQQAPSQKEENTTNIGEKTKKLQDF
jgi:hypothetical protein